MKSILDTNILISIIRHGDSKQFYNALNLDSKQVYVSIASVAEIKSLAVSNRWGEKRMMYLREFLNNVHIVQISDYLVRPYVEIDTFSKRTNPKFTIFPHETARVMGKNDLWIAATAVFLNLSLITTDKDFKHLNTAVLPVNYIEPTDLKTYFV